MRATIAVFLMDVCVEGGKGVGVLPPQTLGLEYRCLSKRQKCLPAVQAFAGCACQKREEGKLGEYTRVYLPNATVWSRLLLHVVLQT
jgi:hypothetical protein